MRISVALCTYNGAAFLGEQLASYLGQTRLPDELVVCDDGSSDNTMAILRDFAARAPIAVRLQQNQANLRSTKNFEQAIRLCAGDVIALSDQDDVWLPEKLERLERVFTANSDITLVFSDARVVNADLSPTGLQIWPNLPFTPGMQRQMGEASAARMLLRYNLITGAACAFRAELREVILPIPERWVHDAWIGFLAAATGKVGLIADPLILYRRHPRQQIGVSRLSMLHQFREASRKLDREYFRATMEAFAILTQRLQDHAARLRDPEIVAWTRGKTEHARRQLAMRETNRLCRIALAMQAWWAGDYGRFSRGWKAFAADVFLK